VAWIYKRFIFEAAHQLPFHKGKCSREHGHSYVLEVGVKGYVRDPYDEVSNAGMVRDFQDISDVVKPLIEEFLDHQNLNKSLPIPVTTAEMIATWIYGELISRGLEAPSVRLGETASSFVEVGHDDWDYWVRRKQAHEELVVADTRS
jgi:6-pyruvoyltetrahydropterin/6-carboxytetrahydropterin synthase